MWWVSSEGHEEEVVEEAEEMELDRDGRIARRVVGTQKREMLFLDLGLLSRVGSVDDVDRGVELGA